MEEFVSKGGVGGPPLSLISSSAHSHETLYLLSRWKNDAANGLQEAATSGKVLGLVLDLARKHGQDKGKKVGDVAWGSGGFGGGLRRTVWASTVSV